MRADQVRDAVREQLLMLAASHLGCSTASLFTHLHRWRYAVTATGTSCSVSLDWLTLISASAQAAWRAAVSYVTGAHNMKVGYQGEPGAYSEEAARAHFGANVEPVGCRRFADVFAGVQAGTFERGLVPLENSHAGAVADELLALAAGDPTRIAHALAMECGYSSVPVVSGNADLFCGSRPASSARPRTPSSRPPASA